jgi:hypothetical protein
MTPSPSITRTIFRGWFLEGFAMRPVLLRALKRGLLTAAILAVLGYVLADLAGMWLSTQSAAARDDFAQSLRYRMPLTMAAWGFLLVAFFEGVATLLRGGKRAIPARRVPAVPTEDEVEQLLHQLLQQADAAEAARAGKSNPSPCPSTPPAENSPVSH